MVFYSWVIAKGILLLVFNRDTPHPVAKEQPQQDGRRGKFAFRIKPHSRQRCSEGSSKACVHLDPGPSESETELCLSVSCGGAGQQWSAVGTGALGAADLGMVQALLEEVAINPTIELPELTQGWKIDSWGAQTEPCAPGERSSDPTRDCSGLVCVSRSLQQRRG